MAKPNFSEEQSHTGPPQPNRDDLPILDPTESGVKGGVVGTNNTIEDDQGPLSLVDFLWKHRDD